jgi:hypothetical protein
MKMESQLNLAPGIESPPPALINLGTNLGLGYPHDEVLFHVRSQLGEHMVGLETVLQNIEHFAPAEQRRIVDCLPFQFDMPATPEWMKAGAA